MNNSGSRLLILESIKAALGEDRERMVEANLEISSFFRADPGSDIELFEKAFKDLQGNFLRCRDFDAVMDYIREFQPTLLRHRWSCTLPGFSPVVGDAGVSLADDVLSAEVAVTGCECLVATTGSVVLSAAQPSGRALPVYVPVHIVIADKSQLLHDTGSAIAFLIGKYDGSLPSSLHFIAGPSRTGDIEKTLVTGIHGPKDVFVFVLEHSEPVAG
ncbi:LUD domain-containing protein [Agriterribacter sp.]|uniref:LutC/YkgG family protein n=1 Tax=Agriterribacter sp. TaxID=2821509 RepID=UPI002C50FAE6|nr:LUD domain-containing protein [Agriterribacter sp.]HRP56829.1 LUD domain-containing protein [Agriterribacter sp.]